ncbi:hypothetical protein [Spiroplasma endosymbiont of Phyllotreta cruciferae]|nr:hypothetical protein [Spiroplasma endosymbiont of Phyllotreta cruciferae]
MTNKLEHITHSKDYLKPYNLMIDFNCIPILKTYLKKAKNLL